jgi:hypothetical protein
MVILEGQVPVGGGIYWQVQDYRNPGVLTMLVDDVLPASRTIPVPGVRFPEEEGEAWTFDLDAMLEQALKEEHVMPGVVHAFPPWARGRITVEPTAAEGMWRFDITPEMLE